MNVFTTEKCISDTDWPSKHISSNMICAEYLGGGKGTCSGKAMKTSDFWFDMTKAKLFLELLR